jgi:hypothetical protein
MRAARSAFMLIALPLFWYDVAGGGLRAALMFPRGVEDGVMFAVVVAVTGPGREAKDGGARGVSMAVAEAMSAGDEGESGGSIESAIAPE